MSKTKDLLFVIIFPLLIFLAVFIFNIRINYFTSLILVFALPSLYLSLKNKQVVKKVSMFSFIVGIPLAIIFELVAFGDKAWIVPTSIFPFRILGFIPLEDFMWMFLVTYTILIFYESFCNGKSSPAVSKRINVMNATLYPIAIISLLVLFFNSNLLAIPYSYLYAGIILFLIPSILFLLRYKRFTWPFLKVSIFFCYIHLLFELIGLKLNHWIFTGTHFIGWISIGSLKFPIEELIFVMILGGFAACTYYEFFTNKNLK